MLSPQKSFSLSVVCLYCYGAIVYIAYLYKVQIFLYFTSFILLALISFSILLLHLYVSSVPTEGPCKADFATRVILGFTKGRNNHSFSVFFSPQKNWLFGKSNKYFSENLPSDSECKAFENKSLFNYSTQIWGSWCTYFSSATLKKKWGQWIRNLEDLTRSLHPESFIMLILMTFSGVLT